MYSTCLFCNGALGRNESLEHFPVGRRLAFDAAKGRLSVICTGCARWNLSPIESRWEAIEEAERAFRETRLRASTAHVGLAKLKDGTTLVRIGQPLLPEFAAWRYGNVFRNRSRRNTMLMLPGLVASLGYLGAMAAGEAGSTAFTSSFIAYSFSSTMGGLAMSYRRARLSRLTLRGNDGALVRLSAWDASRTEMVDRRDGAWSLRVAHRIIEPAGPLRRGIGIESRTRSDWGYVHMHGDAARRALASMLPTINQHGGGKREVAEAVDVVSSHRSLADTFLAPRDLEGRSYLALDTLPLGRLPGAYRLALEMSLHEADERRALDEELQELEDRWREAEEIAATSDDLFLADAISARVNALGGARHARSAGTQPVDEPACGGATCARSRAHGTNVAGLGSGAHQRVRPSPRRSPTMTSKEDDAPSHADRRTANHAQRAAEPPVGDDALTAEPGGDVLERHGGALKRHGDALADGSGSRQGESPPRVEPDRATPGPDDQ